MKLAQLFEMAKRTDWTDEDLIIAIRSSSKNLKTMFNNPHNVYIGKDEITFVCMAGSTVGAALKNMRPFTKLTRFDNTSRSDDRHFYHFYLNRELTEQEIELIDDVITTFKV